MESGITDLEWIRLTIEESRSDPVGFWSIIGSIRHWFNLQDSCLENFVRRVVVELVKAGACPVVGDKGAKYGWRPVTHYGEDAEQIADRIVNEWRTSGVDPDIDGVWFAFPNVWEE